MENSNQLSRVEKLLVAHFVNAWSRYPILFSVAGFEKMAGIPRGSLLPWLKCQRSLSVENQRKLANLWHFVANQVVGHSMSK